MKHEYEPVHGVKYDPQKYYEEVILKDDIDPSDPRGLRRKGALQHWETIKDMVDTSLTERGAVFVGNWEVNSDLIYHRHLELGSYTTFNGHDSEGAHPICPDSPLPEKAWEAFIVVDAYEGKCELCMAPVTDEIRFIHKFFE